MILLFMAASSEFRFVFVVIIVRECCAVNRNAIVFPTAYQKYDGVTLLYREFTYEGAGEGRISSMPSSKQAF